MRIPLAALGPVSRRRRLGILLPVLAVAAVVAGLLVGRGGAAASRAAALAPADTALFVEVDRDDAADIPFLAERVRELDWAGDEIAWAIPAEGEPTLIAEVADPERAPEGERVGDFLITGPFAADGPSLADSPGYQRSLDELDDAAVALYAPAEGVRALLERGPALVRELAAPVSFDAVAARVTREREGVRVHARVLRGEGAPPPQEFAPALLGRAPASAAAFLDVAGADVLLTLLERGGQGEAVDAVRSGLPGLAGLDLDRDVIAPLAAEAALTLTADGATPVITLAGRTSQPALTREALARLQQPLAAALGVEPPEFRAAGDDAFTLPATPQLQPSYALDGDVLVASTGESGLEQRTLARRGLAQELALRAVAEQVGGRIEALAFADLRQLLALGERTGLNLGPGFPAARDDLMQVRAVSAVVRREESDSTAELFLEIP